MAGATPHAPEHAGVAAERLPGHVGIIMDGNGRWAAEKGLPRQLGHRKGADAVREVVRTGRSMGLRALTLFAFSSQNWDRPHEEVFHLMQLLREYLLQERAEILDNNIRLQTVGETERLPEYVRAPLQELMAASAHNTGMILCLALSYGGREMLARAAREMCKDAVAGRLQVDDVTTQTVAHYLPSSRTLPPLDLLIRTSGEHRISNFFLWEAAYAELAFSPTLWPDFGAADLLAAVRDFGARERRFGLTSQQVRENGLDASPDPNGDSSPTTTTARTGAHDETILIAEGEGCP